MNDTPTPRRTRNMVRAAGTTVAVGALTVINIVPVWAYDWSMWPGSRRFNCYWFAVC